MAEKASKAVGKYVALSVLIASLSLAIIGFYLVLLNWNHSENSPISISLLTIVSILILLIISMMWKIAAGMRKAPEEESLTDSPFPPLE
ncbi:MAG: hypothetical protein V3U09_08035 [Thermoplasmata archaeon]